MSLPTPYYSENGIVIYNADCRDILPHLEPVDLVLTDPPYGIGELMKGGTWGTSQKYEDMRRWDVLPSLETIGMVLDKAPIAIVWGGNYFGLGSSRCWLVWDKQNAVTTTAACELAWTNMDRPVRRFSWPVGVHVHGHPTEKPLELIAWCIEESRTTGTIIDPFMGSGTTLRAAKDLGRKAIGIEIEERYAEIAAKRLQQEVLSLSFEGSNGK